MYNSKSDTCCEEISLQTLSHSNEKQGMADNHIVRAMKNGSVHHKTVKNGQATIIDLDGESEAVAPSINNNSNSRRASAPTSGNKGRFGKFLDVSQKRRKSNLPDIERDACSQDFIEADKVSQMPNCYKSISWHRDQSDATRDDSDSEDPVLSAFGIVTCSKT